MKTTIKQVLILCYLLFYAGYYANAQNKTPPEGFVYAEGEKFMLDGNPYYFSGTNVYDFFTYGSSSGDIETQFMDKERIDAHMRRLYVNGIRVVRVWGFSHEDWHGFETEKGVYSEAQFSLFDYVVKSAEANGIKLIIALENYWNDYGGIKDRLKWEGIDVAGAGTHDQGQFFTNESAIQGYKDYVEYFITRANHYDGVEYRNDPTILAWELMNEPRYQTFGDDLSSDTLRAWVDDMGKFIKDIDANHLLGTGLEGHGTKYNFGGDEGNDFIKIHQSPFIDFTSAHPYIRESWSNFTLEETMALICTWADESHKVIKKPLYVGEFNVEIIERFEWWEKIYEFIEEKKIGGSAFWWFPDNNTPRDKFGVFEGDVEVDIYKKHALKMEEMSGGESIYLSLMSPKSGDKFVSGGHVHIETNLINDNNTVAKVEFYSNGVLIGKDTTAPYEFDLSGLPDGQYSITSIATGVNGETRESTPRNIQIGGAGILTLEYKDASSAAVSNIIKPHFRLFNNASQDVSYADLSIRYWYETEEDLVQSFFVDYAVIGSDNIKGRIIKTEGNMHYMEVTFDSAAGVLGRNDGSGTIETKIANSQYSDTNQANDYSYDGTKKEFIAWEKIGLYLNGKLVSGIEPTTTVDAPKAIFTTSTIAGDSPLSVIFDASGSTDPNGDTLTYSWDFGNGDTATSITSTYEYTVAGEYQATLTVTDGTFSDTETVTITVNDPSVVTITANIASDVVSGLAPITINFDASGSIISNNDVLTYTWDFGDGTTGSGVTIAHEYTVAGNYNVELAVTNGTISNTDILAITVNDSGTVGDCNFGAPSLNPLPTIANTNYTNVYVIGSGGPDLSNMKDFTINWNLENSGLWQLSMNTNNGIPNWWNDLKSSVTSQTFNLAQPSITLSGTGFPNLDGDYYAAVDSDNFALVSKSGAFTIYFSNSNNAPNCEPTSNAITSTSKSNIKMFPNPARNSITISGMNSGESIIIYDLYGQPLKKHVSRNRNQNESLDISNFKPGLYIISIPGKGRMQFIKE